MVRLPVANCELNPIEMAQYQVYMCTQRFMVLVYQGFEGVTPVRWQSLKHVQDKVEDHYWEADGLNEELLERFNINNSNDSDSDSDDAADAKSSSLPTASDEVRSFGIDFM